MSTLRTYLAYTIFGIATAKCQELNHVDPIQESLIIRKGDTLTFDSREPRPLRQATAALRAEYGWVVDYEDPIYLNSELLDDAGPQWREAHPLEPGLTKPTGEQFIFSVPLRAVENLQSGPAKMQVLTEMIRQYGISRNPGRFTLVEAPNRRFAIVGLEHDGKKGIFDCDVVLKAGGKNIEEQLAWLFENVSGKTGIPIKLGFAPMNVLVRNTRGFIGDPPMSARVALAKILDQTSVKLVYEALYDSFSGSYMVNIQPAVRNKYNVDGTKSVILLRDR